jgi:HPr kinase/phosphorylase
MEDENNSKVTIKQIKEFFNYKVITGNEEALSRWVILPDVNRPGLELSGFFVYSEPKRIVIIGNKETEYMKTLEDEFLRSRFEYLTDSYTPCIIITKGNQCHPILKEIAESRNFPILTSSGPTSQVMVDIVGYLDDHLGPQDSLHGVLMSVYGTGVLLTGESGMGKSEIALELIKSNHIFVSDDRVDVIRTHNTLVGRAPELLKGFLEIRGIGIIDVNMMFGASSVIEDSELEFVIYLQKYDPSEEYDRVGIEEQQFKKVLGLDIPMITLPVKEGRAMGALVEAAVTNFRLKQSGYDSAKAFEQNVLNYIKRQNEVNKANKENVEDEEK